jgi:hypothetical protein
VNDRTLLREDLDLILSSTGMIALLLVVAVITLLRLPLTLYRQARS